MFHKATLGMTKRASKVCQGSSPDAAVHPLMWAKIYKSEVCMYRHFFTNYIHIQIILALVYIYMHGLYVQIIWAFPEMGLPLFIIGFPLINHPFGGFAFMKRCFLMI